MNDTVRDAIARQMNRELYSGYLYLSMSAWLEAADLQGAAHWMRRQAEEEKSHAMKMFGYLAENGARIQLMDIETPPAEWADAVAVFEHVLSHEKAVTGLIMDLVAVAEAEGDSDARSFLQWYIKEQEEEEESAGRVLAKVRAAVGNEATTVSVDMELGSRN